MFLVRPAVSEGLGLQGTLRDGPWSYRICSLVIMTPTYAALLVCVGTVFARHAYFRHFGVRMFSRFGCGVDGQELAQDAKNDRLAGGSGRTERDRLEDRLFFGTALGRLRKEQKARRRLLFRCRGRLLGFRRPFERRRERRWRRKSGRGNSRKGGAPSCASWGRGRTSNN